MPVTATPAFTQAGLLGQVQVSVANTNRDGITGTYSTPVPPGTNGSIIDGIVFKATGTTAAGTLRIFMSNGTNAWLLDEVTALGVTPSGTVPSEILRWVPPFGVPFPLPVGYTLKFNVNNAETWTVFVEGGSF